MGLKGKLIAEFETRSSGDLFHDLLASKPHHISKIAPAHIQGCELHEGEFGKNGSIIFWNYTNNGKACVSRQVVENMDEVIKSLTHREIEGDLLKNYYKSISVHLHVKTGAADDISVVNWTLEYEKLHEEVPYPTTVLEMLLNMRNNIENHHLKA